MSEQGQALPLVDEHSRLVEADAEATWRAADAVMDRAFGGTVSGAYARLIDCEPPSGFERVGSVPGQSLVLAGRHRFSRYELTFTTKAEGARTLVTATTRAQFPGLAGGAYRALVIGTRGHVFFVKRMLAAIAARAERSGDATLRD